MRESPSYYYCFLLLQIIVYDFEFIWGITSYSRVGYVHVCDRIDFSHICASKARSRQQMSPRFVLGRDIGSTATAAYILILQHALRRERVFREIYSIGLFDHALSSLSSVFGVKSLLFRPPSRPTPCLPPPVCYKRSVVIVSVARFVHSATSPSQ